MDAIEQMSDEELVELYIDGSNEAFDVILSRYQDYLFSYVLLMVKDRDCADDIFQDVFVKVISSLKSGQYTNQGGLFRNWLMRIAHNVVIDHFRRNVVNRAVRAYSEEDTPAKGKKCESVENVEEHLVKKQICDDVWHMVEYLPDNQKEIINMRFRDELPFKEIAKITNVSINTSLGRMRYALINLRRMVNKNNILLR